MLFNSCIFVLPFLPLSVAGYFLLNKLGKRLHDRHENPSRRENPRGDGYTLGRVWLLGMTLWLYAYFNIQKVFWGLDIAPIHI